MSFLLPVGYSYYCLQPDELNSSCRAITTLRDSKYFHLRSVRSTTDEENVIYRVPRVHAVPESFRSASLYRYFYTHPLTLIFTFRRVFVIARFFRAFLRILQSRDISTFLRLAPLHVNFDLSQHISRHASRQLILRLSVFLF